MEDHNERAIEDMEKTRSALTEKLEALESQVVEKTKPVAEAVERASAAAADIVENVKETVQEVKDTVHGVKETVHGVKETVEETVTSVSAAFNIRRHAERNPWIAVSVATLAGYLVGTTLGAPRRSAVGSTPRPGNGTSVGNGLHRAHKRERDDAKTTAHEGLFAEELGRLKALALGAVMAVARDLAKRVLPESISAKVAEELERLTTRLGAEPIRGPVLSERPRKESDSDARREKANEGFDRMRSGGSPMG
jgi:hypothetical protein